MRTLFLLTFLFSATVNAGNLLIIEAPNDKIDLSDLVFGDDCSQLNTNTCVIKRVLTCQGTCTDYSQSNDGNNRNAHAHIVASSAASYIEPGAKIIVVSSGVPAGLDWAIANYQSENISVVNISSGGAGAGNSTYQADIQQLESAGIHLVISASNNAHNGFEQNNIGYYDYNRTAKGTDAFVIGAGPRPNKPNCPIGPSGDPLPYKLLCQSNAISNSVHTSVDFYVENGCYPAEVPSANETNCGTSFAAPKFAAQLANLKSLVGNKTHQQVIQALEDASPQALEGAEGNFYRKANFECAKRILRGGSCDGDEIIVDFDYIPLTCGKYSNVRVRSLATGPNIASHRWRTYLGDEHVGLEADVFGEWGSRHVTLTVTDTDGNEYSKTNSITNSCWNVDKVNYPSLTAPTLASVNTSFIGCFNNRPQVRISGNFHGSPLNHEMTIRKSNLLSTVAKYEGSSANQVFTLAENQSYTVSFQAFFTAGGLSDSRNTTFTTPYCFNNDLPPEL